VSRIRLGSGPDFCIPDRSLDVLDVSVRGFGAGLVTRVSHTIGGRWKGMVGLRTPAPAPCSDARWLQLGFSLRRIAAELSRQSIEVGHPQLQTLGPTPSSRQPGRPH
jgi:hypothetical protein